MNKASWRRLSSAVLCAAMILSLFSVTALAETSESDGSAALQSAGSLFELVPEEELTEDVPATEDTVAEPAGETDEPSPEEENLTDHTRSAEYSTVEFCEAYPVAEEDFSLDSAVEDPASSTDISWDNITWTVEEAQLTVTGTGAMPDCDDYTNTPWNDQSYTSVSVGGNLTSFGANIFSGDGVLEATAGESIAIIGENAFLNCPSLEKIAVLNPDCEIYDASGTLGDPDVTVIYCYYNSTAVEYAEKHGYDYVILGYANCTIELEITTTNSADEPTVRLYNASATDLEIYEDITGSEPSTAEHAVVSVSRETQGEDGLYTRTVYLYDVEPGRYNVAAYIDDQYVLRADYVSLDDDINIGTKHMWRYGDVDDNGVIDARDATQVCRIYYELPSVYGSGTTKEEALRLKAADLDFSGTVDTTDAQLILNSAIGASGINE